MKKKGIFLDGFFMVVYFLGRCIFGYFYFYMYLYKCIYDILINNKSLCNFFILCELYIIYIV